VLTALKIRKEIKKKEDDEKRKKGELPPLKNKDKVEVSKDEALEIWK
jgi:hypothetical protein